LVSVLGYCAVSEESGRDAMKWIVGLLSIVHVNLFQRWREGQRQELRLDSTPVQPLSESKTALALCMAEVCFHLLVLPLELKCSGKYT